MIEYINFNISWTGSNLIVTWLLPTHLQDYDDIEVELRLHGEEEWVPVHQGSTVSVSGQLDLYTVHQRREGGREERENEIWKYM